jgi:hypothetical protein
MLFRVLALIADAPRQSALSISRCRDLTDNPRPALQTETGVLAVIVTVIKTGAPAFQVALPGGTVFVEAPNAKKRAVELP